LKSGLFNEEEFKLEAKKQSEFLNSVIGIVSFTLALTCMGFDKPDNAAILCLGIIIPLLIQSANHYPVTLKAIRDLEKTEDDPHITEVRKYLEGKYLGYKALFTTNIIFIYGIGIYLLVLVKPENLMWLKN
jgi:hypothetical protein